MFVFGSWPLALEPFKCHNTTPRAQSPDFWKFNHTLYDVLRDPAEVGIFGAQKDYKVVASVAVAAYVTHERPELNATKRFALAQSIVMIPASDPTQYIWPHGGTKKQQK